MITLIAAMDDDRLIGCDNALPWHLPEDFKHFRDTTMGHPILMGRRTYESLPRRPLPGRRNLVVSSRQVDGVETFDSIEGAITEGLRDANEIFVIGGQSVYEQTIDGADRLLITHVAGRHVGDFYFPEIVPQWRVSRVLYEGTGFHIAEYLNSHR